MPLPAPPVPLVDTCSTIYNNTLYTYSSAAFQSLPLTPGAKWSTLTMGESVSGAVCVLATPTDGNSPVALYVVGGTTNSSDTGYKGLQRYIFPDRRWESIPLTAAVTQNRIYHSAVYLNASSTILVYAGTQDGSMRASSQTFTISTMGPSYTVLAYQSIAPPAISPLLMPWSDTTAVMIGGGDSNRKVMLFSPSSEWVDSGITLAEPLKGITAVKGAVLSGDDGSKNLFTFDMTVSPNQVNRTILIDGDRNPVSNAGPAKSGSVAGREVLAETEYPSSSIAPRGNLTVANWPAYNASLAPTTTRMGFTVAQDSGGLVVISGGNTDDVLCIFRCRDNSWTNATALLSPSLMQQDPGATSATSSSTPTVTRSTASNTAPSSPSSSSTPPQTPSSTVLGAIVGSTIGLAVLVIIVLLLVRWRHNRRRHAEAGHQRRASGISPTEKDAMDFSDRGVGRGDRSYRHQGHAQQESQGSLSSVAMLMGKVNHSPKRSTMGRRNGSNGSDSSSTFNKKYKTAISNPIPQNKVTTADPSVRVEKGTSFTREATAPAPRPRRASAAGRRGSTRRSSGWNRYWSGGSALNILGFGSKREEFDRTSGSFYSEAGLPTATTQPPLNLSRPTGHMSRVVSNSPTIGHASSFPLREGVAGQIERSDSTGSASSHNGHRDTASTGVPASVRQESWTPAAGTGWGPGGGPPEGAYSDSYFSTILPRSRDPSYYARPAPQHSSDMSWLNLGAGEQRG